LNAYNISYSCTDEKQEILSLPNLTDKEIKIRRWHESWPANRKDLDGSNVPSGRSISGSGIRRRTEEILGANAYDSKK